MKPDPPAAPSPGDLKEFRRGAEWAVAAATALELGVFEALAEGAAPADRLAGDLSLDPRGARILLGVLADLGLVRPASRRPAAAEGGVEHPGEGERDPAWALTGQARARFVDRDTPDHEAPALRQWLAGIRRWAGELPEAVRRGHPPGERGTAGSAWEDREALARFMAAMDAKEPSLVDAVAERTLARLREGPALAAAGPEAPAAAGAAADPEARAAPGVAGAGSSRGPGLPTDPPPRVLDLGGGPGTFARGFLRRGAEVVLADRPEVVAHVAEAYGLGSVQGLELWGGDFLEALPDGPFDVVLLANITHIYDPATDAALVRRVAGRLRPGGVLSILDFVRGVSGFASLFAVTMLLNTERGDTYGRAEYEAWIRDAGLESPRLASLDGDRQLLTARKPAA